MLDDSFGGMSVRLINQVLASFIVSPLVTAALLGSPAAAQTPPGAAKNVQLMKTITEAKNATAINFLEYKDKDGWGRPKTLDVMLVTGRFGL